MGAGWEYQVVKLGGTFRGFKPQDLQDTINAAAEDSWEPFLINRGPADGELILILRRQTETRAPRRPSKWGLGWP
jgi:hypothetical protein